MTRVAFFDLDGTLTDPKPGICGSAQFALREMGLPVPPQEELEWLIGPPMIESMRKLAGERAEEGLRLYRQRYGETGLFENRVYDGIPELLQQLRDGDWRLMVATSKAEPYAIRIVEHFGLGGFFDRVYGAGLDGSLMHKDELLSFALEDSRVAPARAAMIGDRKFDVLGAGANGLRTIGVLWGYGGRAELEEAGAASIVSSPREIEGALCALIA